MGKKVRSDFRAIETEVRAVLDEASHGELGLFPRLGIGPVVREKVAHGISGQAEL